MTTETEEAIAVTVRIPKQLYNRSQQQAIQKQYSLEDELLTKVATEEPLVVSKKDVNTSVGVEKLCFLTQLIEF